MMNKKPISVRQKINHFINMGGKFRRMNNGFTLIEIIIVIAIVVIIAVMGVGQYVKQQRNATVATIAEDLALNLRRAQSMAMAVNATDGAYQNGYGLYFNLTGGGGNQNTDAKSYILFTDYPDGGWDHAYLSNSIVSTICGGPQALSDECLEKISFNTEDSIYSIEFCDVSLSVPCVSTNILAISFLRPNLDAYFCNNPAGGSPSGCLTSMPGVSYVKITLKSSSQERTKTVFVYSTGAISVE